MQTDLELGLRKRLTFPLKTYYWTLDVTHVAYANVLALSYASRNTVHAQVSRSAANVWTIYVLIGKLGSSQNTNLNNLLQQFGSDEP